MTFEPGPEPDPDALAHGDFDDPDDLITEEDSEDDPDAEPVNLYSDKDRETYVMNYPDDGDV